MGLGAFLGAAWTAPSRRAIVVGTGLLAVLTLLVVLAVEAPGLDVIARGHFVDYTANDVERVRVGHAFTVLAAPETTANTDLMNTIVLGALAGMTALAALLARERRLRLFFALAAVGAAVLAVDEGFELSETVVYNIGWLGALGPVARKLDVLDAIPVLAFAWSFRDVMRSSAAAVWFWSAGLVFFLFTLVLEVAATTPVEDAIEVVASTSVLLGFVAIAVERLRP
jgi:hypothetical protein